MINKRYGLYLSNNKNTSFYYSQLGNLYAINDINSDVLTDPIEWNYGGISNYKGKCYGKGSYRNYEGSNLTNPLNLISTGGTTTGGMQLIFYKGYVLNKTTRKFIHNEEVGTISLTGDLKGVYFYNNYWYIINAKGVFKSATFDASESETVIDSIPSTSYTLAFGVGNKIYIIGSTQRIRYINLDSTEPEWTLIDTITDTKWYNFTYYKDGVAICTDLTLYFIKESGITSVTNISGVQYNYCHLVDDFVNEQILIGTATTGNIDVIKYNGQRVAMVQSPNLIGFLFPFYREYEVDVTGEHISYEHNGVLDYNNDVESYCVNNEEDYVVTIHTEQHYQIVNIISNYGVIDLDNGTVTYNNRDSYTVDTIIVETEFVGIVPTHDYLISQRPIETSDIKEVNCSLKVLYNDNIYIVDKIIKSENDISFIINDLYISYLDIQYVRVLEDFKSFNIDIYNMFILGENVPFAYNIEFNITVDEHLNYRLNDAILLNNNKYFVPNHATISFIPEQGYQVDTITTSHGVIEGGHINLINLNDDINVIASATSKIKPAPDDVTITLYQSNSNPLKMNKKLTLIDTITGKLRNVFSIEEPVIMIERSVIDFDYVRLSGPSPIARYYYVKDFVSTSYNVYTVHLTEDYKMSWKQEALTSYALVERYSGSDKLVDDPLISTKLLPTIEEHQFSGINTLSSENKSYVIVFKGDTNSTEITTTLSTINNPALNDYSGKLLAPYDDRTPIYFISNNFATIQRFLLWIKEKTLDSYIYNVYAYPIDLLDSSYGISNRFRKITKIFVGGQTYTPEDPDNYSMLFTLNWTYITPFAFDIPQEISTSKLKHCLKPRYKYDIFVPYVGMITLDSIRLAKISNPHIVVTYTFDLLSGAVNYYVTETTTSYNLASGECQMSETISISSDNEVQNNNRRDGLNTSLNISLISSALAGIGSATSGNVLGLAGSVVSAGGSLASYMQSIKTLYPNANLSSITSGNSGKYNLTLVRLFITKPESNITDEIHYGQVLGFAHNDIMYLGDAVSNSFIKVAKINLNYGYTMTKSEYDNLLRELMGGFYK